MSLHKEIEFENDICDYLSSNGWLYAQDDAQRYDRALALFPEDVAAWVQQTQPATWAALQKNHGTKAAEVLCDRVSKQIATSGSLEVIRQGIDFVGVKGRIKLAEFKPAFAMNPDITARYAANRLRVIRQVRYSLANENSIDLVLFLNGIPVTTVELKSDFTQGVQDAVNQYRFDRLPKPKGGAAEPLLSFPGGALVHFAVSNSEVHMATKLEGPSTRFLPFNRGDDGGKGNPIDPTSGHRTAYLWRDVWARDSWLEILGRYLVPERDDKKNLTTVIFPRFHQLDATRKLQAAVLHDGPGGRYLVQHSAGSGKTNSIAWSAHFLSELHDAEDKKLFSTVIVVSDRNVIDSQLQDALFGFQRQLGVVATIKNEESSKSAALAEALSGDKKIVVCTIQTFPFALEKVRELAATEGKKFAVIADEAHSSQAGTAAANLRAVLSPEEIKEIEEGGEISAEDLLAAQMTNRADDKGITFVAFTATPKAKTIELFGTRPDPARKPASDNVPAPFHVYSMRQAIEEGFILDVLQNYTSYKLAFKLAHDGKEYTETEVDKSVAMKGIMGWVRLHPYNISQKVQIVVEHYRDHVAPLLEGKAKAMVVVGSRLEAVRWQIAIQKYVGSKGYKIGTVVAFSGEVNDPDSGPDPFTETSKTLNPNLRGRDIRKAFKGTEYQILLVANKFQTGFDEPLLCAMYVDKRLAGIQAVQTLSRLNRAYPGKDTTYVIDFTNDPQEVLEGFKVYYDTAQLADTTDPSIVLNLRAKLDAQGHYDDYEVERVVTVELNPHSTQGDLLKAISPVEDRLMKKFSAAKSGWAAALASGDERATDGFKDVMDSLILFRTDMGAFVRLYTFLSQIFDYQNTDIEKRAIFYRRLIPLLEFGREREGIDLSTLKLSHHALKNSGSYALDLNKGDAGKLEPLAEAGTGQVRDQAKVYLAELIAKVNDLFDGELSDDDKLVYVNNVIRGKLLESKILQQQAASNTKEQFAGSPDLKSELMNAIMSALDAHSTMSKQALESSDVRDGMTDMLLQHAGLWEELRSRVGA